VTSGRRCWWLAGAALGLLFVALNLVSLAFVEGSAVRDLLGLALGGVMAVVALGRFLGWGEARA
jgi:hypothetical protein